MSSEEREWISTWMKMQEEINMEIARQIDQTSKAVMELMLFTGMIDNRPLTAEEEDWARKIAEERK